VAVFFLGHRVLHRDHQETAMFLNNSSNDCMYRWPKK